MESYCAETKLDGRMDGQMDRQTDGQVDYYRAPASPMRGPNYLHTSGFDTEFVQIYNENQLNSRLIVRAASS